jgi:putative membrane protein
MPPLRGPLSNNGTAAVVPASDLSSLAGVDAAVPVGLLACGAIIAWLSKNFPAEIPSWVPWRFSWSEFLITALSLWWYIHGIALCRREERPLLWRGLSFVLGVMSIYAVLQTRYDYIAQHVFFLHRVQHLVMHHLGPFLIALAWPGAAIRRGMPAPLRPLLDNRLLLRLLYWVQQPLLASFLFVGLIYLWLIPAVHLQAMLNYNLYALMNWSMVVDGILFWCLVFDPRLAPPARISFVNRMITVVLVVFPQIVIGLYIALTTNDLYKSYDFCGRLFPSISAMTDQHIGGLIITVPAAMMSLIAFVIILNRHLLEAE